MFDVLKLTIFSFLIFLSVDTFRFLEISEKFFVFPMSSLFMIMSRDIRSVDKTERHRVSFLIGSAFS